ncbi:unnamed protein product [Closterium sp. Naga37s-1]|nr:unnamed protein product [Closterium sp. Naga37s-1]
MTVTSPLPALHRRAAVLLPRPSIRASGSRSLALGSPLLQPVVAVCATRRGLLSSFQPVHHASPASQRVRVAPVRVAASPAVTAAMASAEAAKRPFVGDLGVRSGFVDAVGNTPLIRLNRASQETGCEIYGKAAEASGELREGGVIVEGTAGNTGIGLALVANARGYKTVIVIPETQSQVRTHTRTSTCAAMSSPCKEQEKKDMLRIAGATLVEVPAVPYKNPNNYVKYSGRLAQAIAKTHPGGAIWGNQVSAISGADEGGGKHVMCAIAWVGCLLTASPAVSMATSHRCCYAPCPISLPVPLVSPLSMFQPLYHNLFDNTANRQAHYETTGPEIWAQTEGRVDAFICAIGTGGTLAGTGKYLKERKAGVRVGMVDPMGAAMFSYYNNGTLEAHGSSISEGIGQGRITGNLQGWGLPEREGGCVDFCCQVTASPPPTHTLSSSTFSLLAAAAPSRMWPTRHQHLSLLCPRPVWQVEDAEALPVVYDLLRHEGLCVGLSSGINVAGAMRLARAMGPGHTIVTVLCDLGTRYQGRLFNPPFLSAKGLPLPAWMDSDAEPAVAVPQVFEEVEA